MLVAGVVLGSAVLPSALAPRLTDWLPQPGAGNGAATEQEAALRASPEISERRFWSGALGREMPYTVYLPPGYDAIGGTRYPVLYMLHGLGGDHEIEWRVYGLLAAADALTRAGTIEPLIIVLPEGEDGYWIDHADGGPAWGTYLAGDVVAEIDARFRTIPRADARAVGGNSMGGHGAIQLAINFPDRFGVVGIHSPTLRSREQSPAYFGDREYFEAHNPASLARRYRESARQLRIWMDVGDEDPWLGITTAFHQELTDLDVPHTFRVLPGIHEDAYWTGNVTTYLEFYSGALRHGRAGG